MEYKVIDMQVKEREASWEAMLTTMGAQDWQLCGVVPLIDLTFPSGLPTTKGARLIFSRPQPRTTPTPCTISG